MNYSYCVNTLFPAKVWGKPNDHPILALHGWQDNAGTFDKLIPLLPTDLYVVCLDFCGKFKIHIPYTKCEDQLTAGLVFP